MKAEQYNLSEFDSGSLYKQQLCHLARIGFDLSSPQTGHSILNSISQSKLESNFRIPRPAGRSKMMLPGSWEKENVKQSFNVSPETEKSEPMLNKFRG